MDSALAALLNQASALLVEDAVPGRLGNRHPSIAPYETFRGRPTASSPSPCGNDAIFARLCDVARPRRSSPTTRASPPTRRGSSTATRSAPRSRRAFAARPAAEWVERCTRRGVPAGPINDVARGLRASPSARPGSGRRDAAACGRCARRCGSRTPAASARRPRLGEHDDEMRAWLAEPRLLRSSARLACRIVFGSMKRTSSCTTSNSSTSCVAAIAEEADEALRRAPRERSRPRRCRRRACPRATPRRTCASLSIRCASAPCSRATSTSRFEFDELL